MLTSIPMKTDKLLQLASMLEELVDEDSNEEDGKFNEDEHEVIEIEDDDIEVWPYPVRKNQCSVFGQI